MRALRRTSCMALLLAGVAVACPALAQPVDAATRKAARILAEEGLAFYDRGEHAAALEKFEQADALLSAPTVDLYAARSLAQLGRLLEAAARYEEVTRATVSDDAPDAFQRAVSDAQREREALLPRIPALRVTVQGGRPGDLTVLLDGKALSPDQLGQEQPVDPGLHRVEARSGGDTDSAEITLKEGERTSIALSLPVPPPPPPRRPASPPSPPGAPGSVQRTLGWVGLALGATGMAVWGVTGGLALSEGSALADQGCAEGLCPYDVDAGAYTGLRTASTIGFWAGVSGLAAGAVLLITAPSAPAPSSGQARGPSITAWGGPLPPAPGADGAIPFALGVTGTF